jgi:signal transduction histidine kinase
MRLITEALGDEILEESERSRYVDQLRLNIGALHGLIEDLFELSQLEAGEIAWSLQPVDLGMLVGDTVDAMQVDARAKRVRIVCEIPEDMDKVRANPEKLQRVIFNLLQNAIRHSPARSTVAVRAARRDQHVEIDVVDEGPGIVQADRATVFDAFVQSGERAARGGGGAGLGLAIARAIVEAHGGRAELVDVQRGTCVRFSIPVAGD